MLHSNAIAVEDRRRELARLVLCLARRRYGRRFAPRAATGVALVDRFDAVAVSSPALDAGKPPRGRDAFVRLGAEADLKHRLVERFLDARLRALLCDRRRARDNALHPPIANGVL